MGSPSNILKFTTPPTTSLTGSVATSILPYATYNGSDFATYNTTKNTIIGYVANGGVYKSTVASLAAATDNLQLSASDSISSNTTVNSLSFTGGGTINLSINTGSTLTVTSGAILTNGTTTTVTISGGGTLVLGTSAAGEGVVITTVGRAALPSARPSVSPPVGPS